MVRSRFPVLEEKGQLGEFVIHVEHQDGNHGGPDQEIGPDNPENHLNAQPLELLLGSKMLYKLFEGRELPADSLFGFRCHVLFGLPAP